ncbi:MAG: hypothetical protein KatS3mg022_3148 [Armatimonadota bacterium]|nr:MAG: hypothetical protein KatS3mg022_3148 [Armatimonadota bacterium]
MRFLVDVPAGGQLAEWLRSQGHDVLEVRNIDPKMADALIIELGYRESRIIITLDKDFGELSVRMGMPHYGIVRLPDVTVPLRKSLLQKVLDAHAGDLEKGAIVTVSISRIRVRRKGTS